MDQREYVIDWEETIRTAFAGLMAGQWHAMPGVVTEDSADNHVCSVQPTVKRMITDAVTGQRSYEDHPIHVDVPIKFASGGGVTHTFPITKDLEGIIVYANRDIDSWHQSSGSQQPVTDRMHGYADPFFIPGVRSTPRKLEQVSTTSSQIRSDDGHHTIDHDPARGTTIKSVDPSTPVASAAFSPYVSASKFFEHSTLGAGGILGRAVDDGTEHHHGVDHGGAFMRAMNGLHQVLATSASALLSAFEGAHTVTADASGVQIASKIGVAISCPPGMLSLPAGGISGASIQTGGDLSGTLDQAQVTSLLNVSNANLLPNAANDAAAAALNPPIQVGHLYRNGSALMVRVA